MGEAIHLTVVDILRQLFALGEPGLGDSITERLHLGYQLGMSDRKWSAAPDLVELRWIELLIVVVGGTLSEVGQKRIPGPLLAAKFFPVIKGLLAARNPGEVVKGRASTKDLPSGIGLVNTLVIRTLDERGLVGPIIFAATDAHRLGRRGDFLDFGGVVDTSLDDQDTDFGIFSKAAGNSVASSATSNNDEVEVIGHCYGNRDLTGRESLLLVKDICGRMDRCTEELVPSGHWAV